MSGSVSKITDQTKVLPDRGDSVFYSTKLEQVKTDIKNIKIQSKAFSPGKLSPFRMSKENEINLNKTITNITDKLKKSQIKQR